PEGCWYQLIEAALKPDATEAEDHEGAVLRWRRTGTDVSAGAAADAPLEAPHGLPDWLRREVPATPAAIRALSPSAALDHTLYPGDARALARGRTVHRLLQALPALAADRRAEAAGRHLAGAKELSGAERDAISGEVLAVL